MSLSTLTGFLLSFRALVYVKYGKKTITCQVPPEVSGTITVEVRTRYSSHTHRSGQIPYITPA